MPTPSSPSLTATTARFAAERMRYPTDSPRRPSSHAATAGDPLAWAELFRRFTRRIGAVARAHRLGVHEAEDIVQDTWLRALEHLGELRDPDSVAGWLNTTARRECLRHIGAQPARGAGAARARDRAAGADRVRRPRRPRALGRARRARSSA